MIHRVFSYHGPAECILLLLQLLSPSSHWSLLRSSVFRVCFKSIGTLSVHSLVLFQSIVTSEPLGSTAERAQEYSAVNVLRLPLEGVLATMNVCM